MKSSSRLTAGWVVSSLVILASLDAPGRAAAQQSAADRTRAKVSSWQKTIALFMHPTATLNSASCPGPAYTSDGFTMTYRFEFTSMWGNRFYSHLHFNYASSGYLRRIDIGQSNALVNPFRGADAVINVVRTYYCGQPSDSTWRTAVRLLQSGGAKTTLEWLLRLPG